MKIFKNEKNTKTGHPFCNIIGGDHIHGKVTSRIKQITGKKVKNNIWMEFTFS